MAATENLGYTDIICTGKTGTITEGNMIVRQYIIGGATRDYEPGRVDLLRGNLGKII